MSVQDELVRRLAVDARRRAADRAVTQLKRMRGCLSGDDSGLKTAWEEFCVQVQGEESFFWDAYEETVKQAISAALLNVQQLDMAAMWFQTSSGWDWLAEHESGNELPDIFEPDVVDWVYKRVHDLADDSRHPRVVRFLKHAGDFD